MLPRHFQAVDYSAISAWLLELAQENADSLVLALLPEAEKESVPGIQALFNEHKLTLFGAIFPALLSETGFATQGVTFLLLPRATSGFLVGPLGDDSASSARQIGDALKAARAVAEASSQQRLFLVFDSMLPNTGSMLSYLFDRLGRDYAYTGVSAGSETFQPLPCLFDNLRLISNGALGLVIGPEIHFAARHAYPVTKSLMRASSTQGNRIDKIDGEPAMSVYQRVIFEEFGVTLTRENFYDYAVHHPFGLIGTLDILVRIPVAFNDDGSIFCVGEVPPNSLLRLLKAPSLAESSCVTDLVETLGVREKQPLMAFYCAGRRMHFGSDAVTEIRELYEKSGSTNIFGALSLGEISSNADLGIPQFHNAAVVCAC